MQSNLRSRDYNGFMPLSLMRTGKKGMPRSRAVKAKSFMLTKIMQVEVLLTAAARLISMATSEATAYV